MRTTSVAKSVRRCRRRRQGHRRPAPSPVPVREERRTEQGNRIDVVLLRGFLKRALEDDAVADPVNELIFEHVVAGRYHPSVVAESLPAYIAEILGAARCEDWQAVADELIAEAREIDGEA
ncbi:MAG TPA: hypothetical protein VGC63_07190 [Solirubrobacterales bacterium]